MKYKLSFLVVVFSLVASPTLAQNDKAPVGIIAIGHSGLTGEWSDPNRPGQEAKYNSWATGDAPAVDSIYRRLVAALPDTEGHVTNWASGGAPAAALAGQATTALKEVPSPALVIIQTIDNDIRGDGTDEAHLPEFGAAVAAALDIITQASPESRILIVGLRGRPATYAAAIADIPEAVAANSFFFNADGTLNKDFVTDLTSIIASYEAEQARVCAAYPQCATDGGAFASYVDDISDYASDYNHANVQGNARAAAIMWPVVKALLGL